MLLFGPIATNAASVGSFLPVAPMNQFRRTHTATLLANGRVLVAGGSPLAPAATSELYDPVTLTWTNSGALSVGREFHTATLLPDGRVIVTGGQTANQLLASTEAYDTPSGQWTGAGALSLTNRKSSMTPLAPSSTSSRLVTRWSPTIAV